MFLALFYHEDAFEYIQRISMSQFYRLQYSLSLCMRLYLPACTFIRVNVNVVYFTSIIRMETEELLKIY